MSWKFNPFTGSLDLVNDASGSSLYEGALNAAPGSPVLGTMYYNRIDLTLYVYDGDWVSIAVGTPASFRMLTEGGDNLALENGNLLRIE